MFSLVFPLWQLPGLYLAGPLLLAFFSYGIIRSLKADSIWPEATTRTAALVCGCAALGFLFFGAIRSWNYHTELTRARRVVSNFPAWPLAWQDLSLALIAENQGEADRKSVV